MKHIRPSHVLLWACFWFVVFTAGFKIADDRRTQARLDAVLEGGVRVEEVR